MSLLPVDSNDLRDDASADGTPSQTEPEVPGTPIAGASLSTRLESALHHLVHADLALQIRHFLAPLLGVGGRDARSIALHRHRHGPSP